MDDIQIVLFARSHIFKDGAFDSEHNYYDIMIRLDNPAHTTYSLSRTYFVNMFYM